MVSRFDPVARREPDDLEGRLGTGTARASGTGGVSGRGAGPGAAAGRSRRSATWVRQEKPSARTTASGGGVEGRQQVLLGDGDRDLVVARSRRRSCRPGRSSRPGACTWAPVAASRSASAFQPRTAWWWQCGWATTSMPDRSGGVQPGVWASSSARVRTEPATALASSLPGSSSWTSERSTAVQEGSMPTMGTPAWASAARAVTVRERIFLAESSWPVVIQVRPQQTEPDGSRGS